MAEASIGLTTLRVWTKGTRRDQPKSTPVAGPSSPRRGLARCSSLPRRDCRPRCADDCRKRAEPAHPQARRRRDRQLRPAGRSSCGTVAPGLLLAAAGILIFGYLQGIVQTYASDRVARDLRTRLIARIAAQDHAYIQQVTPAALLTHLTSDVDAVKMFVAQAVASLISSVFLIVGASVLLIAIDWRLALARAGRAAGHRRHVLRRARPRADALQARAGGDRLAEQGHQREHPRRGAHPAASTRSRSSTTSSLRPIPRRATSA